MPEWETGRPRKTPMPGTRVSCIRAVMRKGGEIRMRKGRRAVQIQSNPPAGRGPITIMADGVEDLEWVRVTLASVGSFQTGDRWNRIA